MKIIIVDTTIHGKLIGGGHLYLPNLIAGLVENNNQVYLVVDGIPNEKVYPILKASGATICGNLWKKNKMVNEKALALAQWVNNLQPDIYFLSSSTDIGWVALPLLDSGIATITIGHTDSETYYLPTRHYYPFITRAIGVSVEVCKEYVTSCNLPANKTDWIPYGVEGSSSLSNIDNPNTLSLIYVGRIEEPQKRISDIIKIAKGLSAENISYHLKIIGDGPEMPALEMALADEIKTSKVQLYGWLNSGKVLNLLRESQIFLLTSNYEGFCIALVEAMANGCCPLVTDIRSGNKQLVQEDQNGFLIEIGRPDIFIEKLKMLLQQPAKLMLLRKAAWNTGKDFTIDNMVNKYVECFLNALAQIKNLPRHTDAEFPLMSTCQSKFPYWLRKLKKILVPEK